MGKGSTLGRLAAAGAVLAASLVVTTAPALAAAPALIHDVKTGFDPLGTFGATDIPNFVQPDTQIEPSIAVNPANPLNVVTAYQEGRIANGGDATNGFATSFDGGLTWTTGELPKLTTYPGQGGQFERASDAVVAFGPGNVVYANSLVFDQNTNTGLRSAMAINVSKDGGRTWSAPVVIQDDMLGGLNDKNWIVVDDSDAPGHHKGRVYVVWDRVAPVVYDYCDHDCDQLSNWLPNAQAVSPVAFPGQGIGAFPVITKSGGLGVVIQTTSGGLPTTTDEPDAQPGNEVFLSAPNAGSTPYPSPLAFLPPVQIGANKSGGVPAQRASDGLPAAASDQASGTLYAAWDDARFRTDGTNDSVLSRSTDGGVTWSPLVRVNPGPKDDHVNHYNTTVAVGEDGAVHVAWRQRDQSGAAPLFSPVIDTYYVESRDGGRTFTAPLKVDSLPSDARYGAFSRDGLFEGDYNQTASSGGYTYIVRTQARPAFAGEPQALSAASATTVALTEAGKGHQHQSAWVALVRDTGPVGGRGGSGAPGATLPGRRSCRSRRAFPIRLVEPRRRGEHLVSAVILVNGKRVATRRGKRLKARIDLRGLPRGTIRVRVVARTNRARRLVAQRTYHTCIPKRRAKRKKHG